MEHVQQSLRRRGRPELRVIDRTLVAQLAGALLGVLAAHAMFDLPILQHSAKVRTGFGRWLAEGIATFGLVSVILGCRRCETRTTALAVAAYITAAFWFTASTSFANPVVTVARSLSDTFAGIAPSSVLGFVFFQLFGAILGAGLVVVLYPKLGSAADVAVPHADTTESTDSGVAK